MYYTIKSILITVTDKNPPKQAERSIKKKKKFYFISWLTSIERSSSAAILPIVILV